MTLADEQVRRAGPPVSRAPAWVAPAAILALVAIPCGMGLIGLHELWEAPERPGWQEWVGHFGMAFALAALALVMIQFSMSARLKLLDRAFGLDRLLRAHRVTGVIAGSLAFLHPLLLFSMKSYTPPPMGVYEWRVVIGAATLALLAVVICTSLGRKFLMLPYGSWLWIHRLVFVVAVAALVHALVMHSDLDELWARLPVLTLFALHVALFVRVKLVRPARLRGRPYVVRSVTEMNHNVCRLELAPAGHAGFVHDPGQFAFIKIVGKGIPGEEHPFTISSPARRDGSVQFSIKASGDFTKLIPRTAAGDKVRVHGPFGRFTCLVKSSGDRPLVMIAGGVGITPILAMLEYLAANQPDRTVTLIWGNRKQRDIFAADQVDAIAARMPNLSVRHVMSHQDDWQGEKGLVDRARLDRLLSPARGELGVFLCGPPAMMGSVAAALRSLGVRRRRIYTERFEL
jgi:3-phenylpropionate/trans-cinnamate dioxygenase ferredoxin reductase subunit